MRVSRSIGPTLAAFFTIAGVEAATALPIPSLHVASSNGAEVVSWPVAANPNPFGLQSSPTLSSGASWNTVTNPASLSADTWHGTNTVGAATAFYRLAPSSHLYALAGQGGLGEAVDTNKLQQEYAAGVRGRLLELGWNVLQPTSTTDWNTGNAAAFQSRIDAFAATGPDTVMILDLGMQYCPSWVANTDPLKDQYGSILSSTNTSSPTANVYWSPTVRQYASNYICQVFGHLNFHGRLWAVRVGPHGGEMLYPCSLTTEDCDGGAGPDGGQSFWAFDSTARSKVPASVASWVPGQASPNGQAQTFYNWYVDNLADTFNYLAGVIRRNFHGYIAPVTPGQGISDSSVGYIVSANLVNRSMCCYGTGNYGQRLFPEFASTNQDVLFWCSSVGDASGSNDSSPTLSNWSSAHMMSYYASRAHRPIFGENPGHDAYSAGQCGAPANSAMQWDFQALGSYGYRGLIWIRESDFGNSCYASLLNYQGCILQSP